MERCTHCGASSNGRILEKTESLPTEPANKLPEVSPEALLAQAMKLADDGANDDAILLCRRAIKLKGDFVAAYAFLGELYERVGEKEKALSAYEKALSLDKDYEPARLGKERLEKTSPKGEPLSQPQLSTPLWDWGGHPLPLLGATALVIFLLFAVRAIIPPVPKSQNVPPQPPITLAPSPQSHLAPATALPLPAAAEVALKRGMEALNSKKYDEAIRWFERALQFAPNNNEARSWLLIARAIKDEAETQRRGPVVATRSEPAPLPVLPAPPPKREAPSGSAEGKRWESEKPSPPPSTAGYQWNWQSQWGQLSATPPQSVQSNPFVVQTRTRQPTIPSAPQSPASPLFTSPSVPHPSSPSEAPPVINPTTGSVPSIPPPPPNIEDLERQAAQKVYENDFAAAVQIYRTILSRGVGIEREGYIRQQLALALQQLRRYDEAAEEYSNAIAAYKCQIEQGINVAAAQRGIEACRRGLEICKRAR